MSFPRWLLRNQIVELRGNERSTHGKKIPKKSYRPLQGSGGDSGSWTERCVWRCFEGEIFWRLPGVRDEDPEIF